MSVIGTARRRVFGIAEPRKVFRRPGFSPDAWSQFGPVIEALAAGYNASLEDASLPALVPKLEAMDPVLHGFAYEGAAMGLAVLDILAPGKRRIAEFVNGPGSHHPATIYVGAGMALARLRRRPERYVGRIDHVLGWAVVDGVGFHEGFFFRQRSIIQQQLPGYLSHTGRELFDQGLGRSLWFSSAANVSAVEDTIKAFPSERHPGLWQGAAIACSFAGGTNRAGMEQMRRAAEPHHDRLAWAGATAAWTRDTGRNPTPHTQQACELFAKASTAEAFAILERTRRELKGVPSADYRTWREACVSEIQSGAARQST
ncbi:DUF1702 family protein [Tsukamurella sp. 8F]|uniref:DUF1702 family protein n=1 Tax=unclassified Tsukamurella TaxID=2633480 RepID=UPI0023BA2C3E|nr:MULTISPECIES: DUF1702 family protein [unclassified Tsukamurella]MDF0531674.1 DUF1702 family protein [Tsukamurella sp. 8J]MDF0588920.1 DUF1702 family protein [Tsukamurella sp. 8F]